MKDLIQQRSHTIAKHVTSGLHKREIYKDLKDPTLERSHAIANLTISVIPNESMKDQHLRFTRLSYRFI